MSKKRFSQEQRLLVLKNAHKLGIKEAARLAAVHYSTVYEWKHQLEALAEELFLAYQTSYPGRGIKEISSTQEIDPETTTILKSLDISTPNQVLEIEKIAYKTPKFVDTRQFSGSGITGRNITISLGSWFYRPQTQVQVYQPVRRGNIFFPIKSKAVKILNEAEANGVFIVNQKK